MAGYYETGLAGDRLRRCYELGSKRVQQYLEAEIGFVLGRLEPGDAVLELGSGYGRIAFRLAGAARWVVGVDTSRESLALARRLAGRGSRCEFPRMDASALAFRDRSFDVVVCAQNGICAFRVDPERMMREALRVTRPGGRVLFSSYASAFWPHRLEWFERQAEAGLIGEIDRDGTAAGTIVCKDGFRVGTFRPGDFRSLCRRIGVDPVVTTVDESSVFCEVHPPGREAGVAPDDAAPGSRLPAPEANAAVRRRKARGKEG